MCSPHTATFPDNNALSNSLRNNLFLDSLNSYPGWLLVTLTREAWWCRYRGHCRSGPRHLSPRSRVCHKNGIGKTFTHTSIPIHPCTLLKKCKNNNSKMLNSPNMMPLFPGPLPVPCAGGRFFRKLGTWSTADALSARTLLTEKICESV